MSVGLWNHQQREQKEKTYFQAKKHAVIQTEYLTDKIIMKVFEHKFLQILCKNAMPLA